jgi:hypothetical protein
MASAAIALSLTAVMPLAGCTNAPPMSLTQPDLTFAQMPVIPVAVAKVEVFEEYKSPMGGANIEHEFQTAPSTAVRNLVQSKLQPAGDRQILRVFIDDASVREEKLRVRDDFMGSFYREPSEKYTGRVALRFELVNEDAPDIVLARANISSDRNNSVLENASLSDRDQAYVALTEAMMNDIYEGLRTTVKQSFGTPH